MTSPTRIQRKRTPGWRLPPNTVIVDRTSRFGNPFTVVDCIEAGFADNTADASAVVTDMFHLWLTGENPGDNDVYQVGCRTFDRRWMLTHLGDLAEKDLACPCKPPAPGDPDHCHAAILLILARGGGA